MSALKPRRPRSRSQPGGDESEQVIAPPYRGGARIAFSVIRTVYVRGFIERDGRPVAYGTLVMRLGEDVRSSPLGGLGEFELQGVRSGLWRGEVEHRDGRCEVEVDIPQDRAPVVKLGVFVCRGIGREIEHDEIMPRPMAKLHLSGLATTGRSICSRPRSASI